MGPRPRERARVEDRLLCESARRLIAPGSAGLHGAKRGLDHGHPHSLARL